MQAQAQPQQHQPLYVYPPPAAPSVAHSSTHSNGSFGTVFVVLAVILVISGIACCLGRLCNKKPNRHGEGKAKPAKQKHKKGHPDQRENDLELGFDKRLAAGQPSGLHGGEMQPPLPLPPPPPRGFKMPGNGVSRPVEPKYPGGDFEFRPGPMR